MTRLRAMILKEFLQMSRDRVTLAMMVGIPIIQLLLFGWAIQTDVKYLSTVVWDQARTSESRALVAAFAGTASFRITEYIDGWSDLDAALASGRAHAAIVIPWSYPRDLARGRTAQVQVVVDATDPLASHSASQAASAVGRMQTLDRLRAQGSPVPIPVDVRVRPRYNPGLVSSVNIVPGLIGVILSLTLVIVTSMAIVREREQGSLEQLIVTPLTKTEIMLGKIAPYVLVGYVQITVVLIAGRLAFDVPIQGSLAIFYVVTVPFIVATLGVGLLVSTIAVSQQQAMQMSFFFILPNILLSGFMFPREAMPLVAQWLGLGLPLTHYLEIVRGLLLKGTGIQHFWGQLLTLVGFAVLLIALSVRRFQKRLA